jgi:hypothetical protein
MVGTMLSGQPGECDPVRASLPGLPGVPHCPRQGAPGRSGTPWRPFRQPQGTGLQASERCRTSGAALRRGSVVASAVSSAPEHRRPTKADRRGMSRPRTAAMWSHLGLACDPGTTPALSICRPTGSTGSQGAWMTGGSRGHPRAPPGPKPGWYSVLQAPGVPHHKASRPRPDPPGAVARNPPAACPDPPT